MSEREPEPTLAPLSPTERDMFLRASTSPMDVVQGDVKTYIDTMIRLAMQEIGGSTGFSPPAGFSTVILKDLTAQTSEYVYVDDFGVSWLYANGVAVSQTTYAALYAFFGANAFAADSGGNFTLPDCRGRAMWMCGTNAATDLGDNDGVAEASRQPKHQHTDTLDGGDHTHSGTTLSVNSHSHTYDKPGIIGVTLGATNVNAGNFSSVATGTDSPSISGNTSGVSDNTLGGSVGSGMAGSDAVAHLVIGSLLIAF